MADEREQLAQLETVLFRFATTDDSQFEPAVQRVLPRVLLLLKTPVPVRCEFVLFVSLA